MYVLLLLRPLTDDETTGPRRLGGDMILHDLDLLEHLVRSTPLTTM